VQVTAMSDEWLTYEEVAERLAVTPRAARARAFRGRWSKTMGNDGRARVRLPDERPAPARNTTMRPTDLALADALRGQLAALESHIKTLQADKEALTQDLAATRADLSAHVASLKTENERLVATLETLKAQLAGAEARASEESAKTAQAIRAFESLAERLESIAAERARPWWRRIVNG
jgi:regulator of replication initiation timing